MPAPVYADTSLLVSLYVQDSSALALRAKRFLTFDERQRQLAELAGLGVG